MLRDGKVLLKNQSRRMVLDENVLEIAEVFT